MNMDRALLIEGTGVTNMPEPVRERSREKETKADTGKEKKDEGEKKRDKKEKKEKKEKKDKHKKKDKRHKEKSLRIEDLYDI